MKSFFLFILLLTGTSAIAQDGPAIEWQKSFGGWSGDTAKSIQPTSDGGYIVGGTSSSYDGQASGNHGGTDFLIFKINAWGFIEWQKCLGGSGNETFGNIRQTSDGGYIAAGTTHSNNGDVSGNNGYSDGWIVKLTGTGNVAWQKCFGSIYNEELNYIEQTKDGGYIATGIKGGGWILKIDSAAVIQWQKNYSGGLGLGGVYLDDVHQMQDGGYIYTAAEYGINQFYFVEKLDSAGNYTVNVGLDNADTMVTLDVIPTTDSGAFVLYRKWDYRYIAVKFNSALAIQWQTTFGNGLFGENLEHMSEITGGAYIITGYTAPDDINIPGAQAGTDYWVIKLNGDGSFAWQKALGSTAGDRAYWGEGTRDGSYILAGNAPVNSGDVTGIHGGDDFWVVKLSNNISVCPDIAEKIFSAGLYNGAYSYQWQIDTGNGFENITNNLNYAGATTAVLTLTNPQTNWYGYKYRCVITKPGTTVTTEPYVLEFGVTWTGFINNDWFNPANWSCSVAIDANTDVIIPAGLTRYPQVSASTFVRSVAVATGASVTVLPGVQLTITGH